MALKLLGFLFLGSCKGSWVGGLQRRTCCARRRIGVAGPVHARDPELWDCATKLKGQAVNTRASYKQEIAVDLTKCLEAECS